jgi:hypothetical protein
LSHPAKPRNFKGCGVSFVFGERQKKAFFDILNHGLDVKTVVKKPGHFCPGTIGIRVYISFVFFAAF